MFSKITLTPVRPTTVKVRRGAGLHRGKLRSLQGLIALTLVAAGASVHASTVSIGALQDATIFGTPSGADSGNASGMGPSLLTGADGQLNMKRSMLQFDLASAGIPNNSTIDNVTLSLSLGQVPQSGGLPQTIRLFDVAQSWSEGSSGSPTSGTLSGSGQGYLRGNGDSTWDYSNYNSDPGIATKWNNGVNDLHGGNFSPTESASSTFTTLTPGTVLIWSSADMAADVQGWLNGANNNGWLLKSDVESTSRSVLGFWSKDGATAAGNPALAPTLEIVYSPVPETETYAMLLAGLGVLGAIVRRRKVTDK